MSKGPRRPMTDHEFSTGCATAALMLLGAFMLFAAIVEYLL